MDDLQFRRNLYADPSHLDEDIKAAMKADASKQQFVDELQAFDAQVAQAMKVDVPEGLKEKLILRQTLTSHHQQKRKTRIHLALAASVAFVLGIGFNSIQFSSAYDQLSDHALAHMYHEEGVFSNNDVANVTLASLNKKMATFGGNFNGLAGELISADFCRFDGIKSLHLVFRGEHAPVTVFVVPEQEELMLTSEFSDGKYFGESIDYKRSSLVIVGEKGEELSEWKTKLNDKITWSI